MAKRLLIDLTECRKCETCTIDCIYGHHPFNKGLVSLQEMATFMYTCRRCEEAPCIHVCPADAFERNADGIVERAVNLCIACKSCVTACPFGTMMNHYFEVRRSTCDYCNYNEMTQTLRCIDTCPRQAIRFSDIGADDMKFIYELNEHVLIKDYAWQHIK